VTAEEKEDISNFARYAGKRLANASLHAPMFEKGVADGREGVQLAMKEGAFPRMYHDVLHAMLAYEKSNGESLTPAYLKVPNKNAQLTDPAAIQEEVMVYLWQNNANFMRRVFRGDDLHMLMETTVGYDIRPYMEARIQELAPLNEASPLEYYLGIHEAYCVALLRKIAGDTGDKSTGADIEKAFELIANNRSAEYVHIAELLYENAQSKNPDPKILLHEFQRILKPLLERLRVKSEREKMMAEGTE